MPVLSYLAIATTTLLVGREGGQEVGGGGGEEPGGPKWREISGRGWGGVFAGQPIFLIQSKI